MSEFAVYLPKPAPEPEVESQVEPMEEVDTGFHWNALTTMKTRKSI